MRRSNARKTSPQAQLNYPGTVPMARPWVPFPLPWAPKISYSFHPDHDFLVLDGIPRNVHQAQMIDDTIRVRRVFHLSCPDRS
ncbi:MAG: nucleoside monophosphate kinase, partial [Chthoniobacterales bacterium]